MRNPRVDLSVLLLCATSFIAGAIAASAQSEVTTYTPDRIQWKQLSYKASKMGVKAESDVFLRVIPASEAEGGLIAAEGDAVEIAGDRVAEIKIENFVKGTDSDTVLLLDPQTAGAYQRSQVTRSKKKNFQRTYRYLANGVFVERRIPKGAATGDPNSWPVSNTRTIPFASGVSGVVSEGMALFYILTAADFQEVGDKLYFYNFDRDGMSEVVMTVEELMPWKVDYIEVSAGKERRVKETRQVARLTISGESVGEGEGAFEFLGLHGEIEIFADPDLRVPIAVRGKVPVAGNMTVDLDRIVVD
jgi:hypothetical protein